MKRIMLVGGEDVHFRQPFIDELLKTNYAVSIVAPLPNPALDSSRVDLFDYGLRRNLTLKNDFQCILQLRRHVANWKPDIVHAFDTKPSFLVPIALGYRKKPVVIRTITGMGKLFSSHGIGIRILRLMHWGLNILARPGLDLTIFQNSTDEEYYLRHFLVSRKKSALIPGSGVNVRELRKSINLADRNRCRSEIGLTGKVVFVMVGRLIKEKGVLEYLQAARKLKGVYSDIAFLLVGPDGANEPGAISKEHLRSYPEVIYLGKSDDIPSIFNLSDVFVLPTKYREGVPRAMLEAMALSLPVIVTKMPGCYEAISGEQAGLLIAPGSVDQLAVAMAKMRDADRRSMGCRALRTVRQTYDSSIIFSQLLNIYDAQS